MMTDEQLLEEYSKEIFGSIYRPSDNLTVAKLIDSHRTLREWRREWNEGNLDAQKEGYKFGYEMGIKCAAENTIQYDDLRKMTVQELANLVGEDT
jgi:transposase-like protein